MHVVQPTAIAPSATTVQSVRRRSSLLLLVSSSRNVTLPNGRAVFFCFSRLNTNTIEVSTYQGTVRSLFNGNCRERSNRFSLRKKLPAFPVYFSFSPVRPMKFENYYWNVQNWNIISMSYVSMYTYTNMSFGEYTYHIYYTL